MLGCGGCMMLGFFGAVVGPKPDRQARPAVTEQARRKLVVEALIGEWKGTYMELGGVEQTLDKKRGKTWDWDFREETVTLNAPGSENVTLPWRVDTSRVPHTIDFGRQGQGAFETVLVGIFQIEGDELTLCMSIDKDRRPTEFTTNAANVFMLFKFKAKK